MDKQTFISYRNTILGWFLAVLISIVGSYNAALSAAKTDTAVLKAKQEQYEQDIRDIKSAINDIKSATSEIKTNVAVLAATKKDK
jgi:hypothetical protein